MNGLFQDLTTFADQRLSAWIEIATSPNTLAIAIFVAASFIFGWVRRGGRSSLGSRAIKGVLATVAIFHFNILMAPAIGILVYFVNTAYHWLSLPTLPPSLWGSCPVWLLTIVALVARDFADYWNHRFMHTKWAWPIHAIHHSDPDVNGLTAFRIHALEAFVMWGSYVLLLTWLGLPASAIGIGAFLLSLHIVYVHIDADWDHGPLKLLIASPRFHRWHHADVKSAYGKNLANLMPLWDWLFGTYQAPESCDGKPMGARGVPQNDVVALMAFPFTQWSKMIAKSARKLVQRPASPIGAKTGEMRQTGDSEATNSPLPAPVEVPARA